MLFQDAFSFSRCFSCDLNDDGSCIGIRNRENSMCESPECRIFKELEKGYCNRRADDHRKCDMKSIWRRGQGESSFK